MNKTVIPAPSVLSANFSDIKKALEDIKASGCPWVHLDVMDGAFVPNITFGPKFIKDIRPLSDLFFDTHLMIEEPVRYIKQFADSGSDCITVHLEACKDVETTLKTIRDCGCKAGLSICPGTDVRLLEKYIDSIDLILIMTVNPGFGGQSLIPECLEKVTYLNKIRGNREFLISVDGGINTKTASLAFNAGIDVAVAGSAFFGVEDKKSFADGLKTGKF